MEMRARGIVLYDFLQVPGGAERATVTLARGLDSADLCVGSISAEHAGGFGLNGLKAIDLGAGGSSPPLRAFGALRAFGRRTKFLAGYEWVVYGGSYAPVAVRNHLTGRNFYYCHAIPRFAYDLQNYYLGMLPRGQRPMLRAFTAYVRRRFEAAIEHMDLVVANSNNVRQRIRTYLDKDSVVVYPPCDVQNCRWLTQGDYYLSTARLEPFKRVDLVVEAFRRMPDRKLLVASGGSELARLRRLSDGARNIDFTGWVDTYRLRELIGRATATIYVARDEDFGISPVESMAAGKPVIGVAEGGLLETVVDGETGVLLPPNPDAEELMQAVLSMGTDRALSMREACERRAQAFRVEFFLDRMREIVRGEPGC